jgi:hypothetical protein
LNKYRSGVQSAIDSADMRGGKCLCGFAGGLVVLQVGVVEVGWLGLLVVGV